MKLVLDRETSKAKNPISKNATKFQREVAMPEIENRGDILASEDAKAFKLVFKSKKKSMTEEKWKNKALHASIQRSYKSLM